MRQDLSSGTGKENNKNRRSKLRPKKKTEVHTETWEDKIKESLNHPKTKN